MQKLQIFKDVFKQKNGVKMPIKWANLLIFRYFM